MDYQFSQDIEKMVRGHLDSGRYASANDLLRDAIAALDLISHGSIDSKREYAETVEAIREGAADMAEGRMQALRTMINKARVSKESGAK